MYQGPMTPPPMPSYQGPATPQPMHMQAGPPPMNMQQGPMGPMAPPGYPPPPMARRSSNGPVIAAVGCSVMVVVVIVIGVIIAAVSSSKKPYTLPSYTYSPRTYSPTPFGGYGVNPAFAGTWTGTGYQTRPQRSQWSIELRLTANSSIGNVKYDNGRCTGILTLQSSTSLRTEMRELVSGSDCAVTGYVTLRYLTSSLLRYEWRQYSSDSTPAATGTLTKQ